MSLLTSLTEHALDEGYAEAAARRPERAAPRRSGLILGGGVLAAGLLLGTAGAQAHNRESVAAQARAALIDKIDQRSADADRLAAEVEALRVSVYDVRRSRLRFSSTGKRLASELTVLEAAVGAAAVTGPAVVIHVENAPVPEDQEQPADPRSASALSDGQLTDRDLQTIVNEMWRAGAEAVAVNGQRLTALSAIRSAGPNILVAFRPLSPPYDVVAIGNAAEMRARLVNGFAGSYLDVLRNYGIQSSVQTVRAARLPASAGLTLRNATATDTGSAEGSS